MQRQETANQGTPTSRIPASILLTIAAGTLLNPLNSSMISVALVTIGKNFNVGIAAVTWLVSGFYLAAAVGQPLMGRLADMFGPRRIFLVGLALVLAAGVAGTFAPNLGFLIAVRVLQAFGTSAAFPAGIAMMRRISGSGGRPPAAALGVISIAANVSAALGPTLGGSIISFSSWRGLFVANIAIAGVGILLALRYLPAHLSIPEEDRRKTGGRGGLGLDIPGILLFGGTLTSLLVFLLSLSHIPRWIFLAAALLLALGFLVRERTTPTPFIDFSMFRGGLGRVYATYATVNTVFYSMFFGLPLWLEQAGGYSPGVVGLLMLPFAGLGVAATPVAARLVRTRGVRLVLGIGMATMGAGTSILLLLGSGTPVVAILGITVVLGVPNAFNNLGLQAALFEAAPREKIGAASGLFQTFRYVGTFLSSALLGIVFGGKADDSGMHILAAVLVAISLALLVAMLIAKPGAINIAKSGATLSRRRQRDRE